ncbi:uncharacterized protein LOC106135662 [Amyelois transitella]|uniref:uncharacterized protein LOC106135662 n=1 Tax=Amyelois transitella TaxID=680683 RepID=UPI00067D9239|nr:uncharacterized protein LOC106135662 [Amyelois transitella]
MILFILLLFKATNAEIPNRDLQFLNELPLEKLLKLKDSLQDFVTDNTENITVTTPSYLQSFGAQALALKGPPIKRTDYEESLWKKESKISNIFSMSVTTLAFLAFGGYLLCLIVQAVKAKEQYAAAAGSQTTLVVNSAIKKRPQIQSQFQPQFASYGRKKRNVRQQRSLKNLDLSPDELFSALLQFCEGYAKWSENVERF